MILTVENCANTCYIVYREKKTTKTKENKKSEWKEKNKRTKERLKTKKEKTQNKRKENKKSKRKGENGLKLAAFVFGTTYAIIVTHAAVSRVKW